MIDTHAHLDALDDPDGAVARAADAGVAKILTVGTTVEGCRTALELADAHEGVLAILGIHPHEAASEGGRLGELEPLLRHPSAVAVGETGLDFYRDLSPRAAQRKVFESELALAEQLGKPVVVHTRAADDDTLDVLRSFGGTVVLHCFSSAGLLPVALERDYYVSFAGNVTYPNASGAAACCCPGARRSPTRGDRLPLPGAATGPGPAERAGERDAHACRPGGGARRRPGRARAADRVERRGRFPAAVSVRPRKELGQHFLVDENILGVIGRLAGLEPDDVVLEIGPGLGVLTRYLARRVSLVHAVEIDRSLAAHLVGITNVRLEFGDALQLDLADLEPPPRKLVSNLPYNVATPIVVESLDGLPALCSWCVMVQREVADRFFAGPGTKAYGAVSVLVRLAAERTGLHPVSRTVFRPPPNVDSALVAFRRTPLPDRFPQVKRVVEAAFAHRRKTLPNSLSLAGAASRDRAVEALTALGRPPDVRAEALEPQEFVELERLLS